ncbi:hypothetical protein WA026_007532 [Henosepilachna vigintioctopunctata]|uniref:FLYWCH-type domain-containing protein n=1 Tax=Henosepilachna vigintioctopunctata TaxID=420089 RepID=A0AAW1UXG0_9CUCU
MIYFLPSGKKYPKIMIENYEFVTHLKQRDSTRWRCGYSVKTNCRAYIITSGKVLHLYKPHNHPPTFNGDTSSVPSSLVQVVNHEIRNK